MRELTLNEIQDVNGGSWSSALGGVGRVLVRVTIPAVAIVGAVLIVGGIAAGYMESHEGQ